MPIFRPHFFYTGLLGLGMGLDLRSGAGLCLGLRVGLRLGLCLVLVQGAGCTGAEGDELNPTNGSSGGNGEPTILVSPENGATVRTGQEFSWELRDADGYILQIATQNDFLENSLEIKSSASSYILDIPELTPGSYYWRVITKYGRAQLPSAVFSFTLSDAVYVNGATTGDIEDGTSVAPFRHIQSAVDFALAHGVGKVYIAGGDYHENLEVEQLNLKGGFNPLTWEHQPDSQTTSVSPLGDGGQVTISGRETAQPGDNINVSHLTFSGNTVFRFVDVTTITDIRSSGNITFNSSTGILGNSWSNVEAQVNFYDSVGITVLNVSASQLNINIVDSEFRMYNSSVNHLTTNGSQTDIVHTISDSRLESIVSNFDGELIIDNSTLSNFDIDVGVLQVENCAFEFPIAGSGPKTSAGSGYVRRSWFTLKGYLRIEGALEFSHNIIYSKGGMIVEGGTPLFENNTIYLDNNQALKIKNATPSFNSNILYNAIGGHIVKEEYADSDPFSFTQNLIWESNSYADYETVVTDFNDPDIGTTVSGNATFLNLVGNVLTSEADILTPKPATWLIGSFGPADRDSSGGWTVGDVGADATKTGPK